MTGHIRRRGERSWQLKFSAGIDSLTGKYRTRYASFKGTKKAAAIELARLIADFGPLPFSLGGAKDFRLRGSKGRF
jgi:hypothetical protein